MNKKYDRSEELVWLRKAYKVYLTGMRWKTVELFDDSPKTKDELLSLLGRGAMAQIPKLCLLSRCFETLETLNGGESCEFRMWYSSFKRNESNRVATVFSVCDITFRNVLKKACAVGMMKQTDDNTFADKILNGDVLPYNYKPEDFGYGYCYNPKVGKLARSAYKTLFGRRFPFTSEDIVNIGGSSENGLKRWSRLFQGCCIPVEK